MKRLGYTRFVAQGRRLGCDCHGRDGNARTFRIDRHSHQHAWCSATRRIKGDRDGIADSPAALAAWLIDLGDGDAKPAAALSAALRTPTKGQPRDQLTRDDVLDNITLFWLTNTRISSARLYWGNKFPFFDFKNVTIPVAVSVFPGEFYQAPRSWVERAYPKLIHYNKVVKGGHFPAWEQPKLFSEELRAGFRSLRA
jgi:pimeloyl-ACP methyl ester carboxylesterase